MLDAKDSSLGSCHGLGVGRGQHGRGGSRTPSSAVHERSDSDTLRGLGKNLTSHPPPCGAAGEKEAPWSGEYSKKASAGFLKGQN